MTRFLPWVLVLGLAATVGCDRRQPATPTATKGVTGGPTPSTKPPFGDPVTTPREPGGKVPPVVQHPSGPVQPVAQGPKVELGDSEQRPVLFFELRTGLGIRVSDIKYDKLGWVDSYEASVQPDKGEEAKVLVRTETPAGGGKAPTHAATVNGKPVSRQSDTKLVGFSVKDTGGVVLARSIKIQTKFSYDPMGRQEVAQQEFQHEGKTFLITYSDYRREKSGRLAGYTARVGRAE